MKWGKFAEEGVVVDFCKIQISNDLAGVGQMWQIPGIVVSWLVLLRATLRPSFCHSPSHPPHTKSPLLVPVADKRREMDGRENQFAAPDLEEEEEEKVVTKME